jgi:hypothetical protein
MNYRMDTIKSRLESKDKELIDITRIDEEIGIVLCKFKNEYVTWVYRFSCGDTNYGYYYDSDDFSKAYDDYKKRIRQWNSI